MRAKRALEEVSRLAGTIRPPATQTNHKGKDKETEVARSATQTSSSSERPNLSSQESTAGGPTASGSRSRRGTTSGRQSVLGEYWGAEVLVSERLAASEINPITDADLWF